jgi:hypothetical protein
MGVTLIVIEASGNWVRSQEGSIEGHAESIWCGDWVSRKECPGKRVHIVRSETEPDPGHRISNVYVDILRLKDERSWSDLDDVVVLRGGSNGKGETGCQNEASFKDGCRFHG